MKEMRFMKNVILLLIALGFNQIAYSNTTHNPDYTLVVEGFDWGPMVNKVIVGLDAPTKTVDMQDYAVMAERSHSCAEVPAAFAKGSRTVVFAYVSDNKGNRLEEGSFITLVLAVAPNSPISSALQYSQKAACRGNQWVDYKVTVTNTKTNQMWNKEKNRIMPLVDEFDLTGKYQYETGKTMSYAYYKPKKAAEKPPSLFGCMAAVRAVLTQPYH